MRILFLDDCNMFEGRDPIANLVEVFDTNELTMKQLEKAQIGDLENEVEEKKELIKDLETELEKMQEELQEKITG